MHRVAIAGAGELGGAIAHVLARSDLAESICLVDAAVQVAAGKALDITQAAPIERFATTISGGTDLLDVAGAAVIVLADRAQTRANQPDWTEDEAIALVQRFHQISSASLILCAGAHHRRIVERAVRELHVPRVQIFGSAPEALAGAIRACVAVEASGSASDVALTVLGVPPSQVIVPWDQATIGGISVTRVLAAPVLRRLSARIAPLWPPGPHALAVAAVKALRAGCGGSGRIVSCFLAPDDTYGQRARAVAFPARLGPLGATAEIPPLDGHDIVALENAMQLQS